ncbi:hypothetical protein AGOR_G00040990 [Albula goreensis]|uniref:Uncharacterized protein n=1 Tax=Albula goreensis TaxID=1534307 RepID=A0A8T3E1F6_9TELE|nr:hypothetical protein AGOR_G00040990 [Albula goreensis]
MSHTTLILLLSTAPLLICTEEQNRYHQLTAEQKKIVDTAIGIVHKQTRKHVNFVGFLKENPDREYYEFHLRPTLCEKNGENTHREDCKFGTPVLRINCAICNDLRESSIHCVQQTKAKEAETIRTTECSHKTGESSSLSHRADKPPECLGCF